MFARIVELTPKPEMKEEIVNVIGKEVLPVLKKQQGFMEFLPFVPETKTKKWIAVSLWAEKRDAERWEREGFPHVEGILKLYLASPGICNYYNVETSLCTHLGETLGLGIGQKERHQSTRPGHPHLERSQGRVREAAIAACVPVVAAQRITDVSRR